MAFSLFDTQILMLEEISMFTDRHVFQFSLSKHPPSLETKAMAATALLTLDHADPIPAHVLKE
jgi:hypothetical protein